MMLFLQSTTYRKEVAIVSSSANGRRRRCRHDQQYQRDLLSIEYRFINDGNSCFLDERRPAVSGAASVVLGLWQHEAMEQIMGNIYLGKKVTKAKKAPAFAVVSNSKTDRGSFDWCDDQFVKYAADKHEIFVVMILHVTSTLF
jgi:hypothetical protein